jgi:exodeoxyribonuclease VII large subunit
MQQRLLAARRRLPAAIQRRLLDAREHFERTARTLHAVSPLATLERGYAIVTDSDSRVITDAARLAPGARIAARVARGVVLATVDAVTPGADAPAPTAAANTRKRPRA